MKRLSFFFICFVSLSFQQPAIKVPDKVKENFALKFPNAKSAVWHSINDDWEAVLKLNGTFASALFKNDGTWLQTESEIPVNQLPSASKTSIKSKYAEGVITKARKIDLPQNVIQYEVEVRVKVKFKEVLLDKEGKLLVN